MRKRWDKKGLGTDHLRVMNEEVQLTADNNSRINQLVDSFTEAMTHSSAYYRRFRNAKNAVDNIRTGKKAEFFASEFLAARLGETVIEPDLEVYSAKHKSWDVDLPYQSLPAHVKSTTRLRDLSWVFQWANTAGDGGQDALFKKYGNDAIVLVYLENAEDPVGWIKGIVDVASAVPLMREPRMKYLKGLKKCLYFEDLVAASNDNKTDI